MTKLDIWLSQPDVWYLEFDRIANEGHLHIQGLDADDAIWIESRRKTLAEAVTLQMTSSLVQERARTDRVSYRARTPSHAEGTPVNSGSRSK